MVGSFDANLGPDGATFVMVMLINWSDLGTAFQELLGYSYRDTVQLPSRLRRRLPWQHPLANQMFVKSINGVKGIRLEGDALSIGGGGGGLGPGSTVNTGPWSVFRLAQLTLQFWRPPYFVRSDAGVVAGGAVQEWLRFVDKNWDLSTQMLCREGSTFYFSPGQGLATGLQFQGSVGQKITKLKVKRRWYQVPETALFRTLVDATPNGIPANILFTQTATVNPITGYVLPAGSPITGCVNAPRGGGATTLTGTLTDTTPGVSALSSTAALTPGDAVFGNGVPLGALILTVDSGTAITMTLNATASGASSLTFVSDADTSKRFFGCKMGTLLFEGVEFIPRPLQIPPFLMAIPFFAGNEPVAQVQYDVVFHFEYFDPPRAPANLVGTVLSVRVTAAGTGYTSAPKPVFGGTGTGAAGTALLSGTGVSGVVLERGGSGYAADFSVTFTGGGGGTGAAATATVLAKVPPEVYQGHNLMPYSGNAFWYAVRSQSSPIRTPFDYADFSDLFQIL